MITNYIKGDIRDTDIKHIAHGVNCMDKMYVGDGVAKALFMKWPKVKEYYHLGCNGGDVNQLGKMGIVCVDREKEIYVINMFTQYTYGNDGKKHVNYSAIAHGFKALVGLGHIRHLAIPKIGSGLAGGDWNIIEQIINDAVLDNINITVYYI